MTECSEIISRGQKEFARMVQDLRAEMLKVRKDNERLRSVVAERTERIHRLERMLDEANLKADILIKRCAEEGIDPRTLRLGDE